MPLRGPCAGHWGQRSMTIARLARALAWLPSKVERVFFTKQAFSAHADATGALPTLRYLLREWRLHRPHVGVTSWGSQHCYAGGG